MSALEVLNQMMMLKQQEEERNRALSERMMMAGYNAPQAPARATGIPGFIQSLIGAPPQLDASMFTPDPRRHPEMAATGRQQQQHRWQTGERLGGEAFTGGQNERQRSMAEREGAAGRTSAENIATGQNISQEKIAEMEIGSSNDQFFANLDFQRSVAQLNASVDMYKTELERQFKQQELDLQSVSFHGDGKGNLFLTDKRVPGAPKYEVLSVPEQDKLRDNLAALYGALKLKQMANEGLEDGDMAVLNQLILKYFQLTGMKLDKTIAGAEAITSGGGKAVSDSTVSGSTAADSTRASNAKILKNAQRDAEQAQLLLQGKQ